MLTGYMRANDFPVPSFEVDSSAGYGDLPPEIFRARQAAAGPADGHVVPDVGAAGGVLAISHTLLVDATVLNIMNEFDFWSAVPFDGTASYEETVERTHLPVDACAPYCETCLQLLVLCRDKSRRSLHSGQMYGAIRSAGPLSRCARCFPDNVRDRGGPTIILDQVLSKYSAGRAEVEQGVDKSAFALFNSQHDDSRYADYWQHLENSGEGEKKGHKSAAPAGTNAIRLAQNSPDLRVVNEHLLKVRLVLKESVPPRVLDRVPSRGQDSFYPQPERGADIYVFKKVPALLPDARVLIFEHVVDRAGLPADKQDVPWSLQRLATATKERSMADFRRVLGETDERFELVGVKINSKSEPGFSRLAGKDSPGCSYRDVMKYG
ncbi:hypothetical protein DL771_001027 [Monosporascus sp. 5C6A]|nr:hypothetical protein DL771_001027 [Monosporascus sp. 5C6A]